ncbi:MAG: hypothetical protein SGI98_04370 [Verrucomicrobiota bacterium]|nr:hypothetical protein [Verrucomicrobiota bacterium]
MAHAKKRHWFLWLGSLLLVLLIAAGAVLYSANHLLKENARMYLEDVDKSEKEYVAILNGWLNRADDPRESYDIQFFLSTQVLDKIVNVLEGRTIQLNPTTFIVIHEMKLDMRNGFPLVRLEVEYQDTEKGLSFGGDIAAVLAFENQEGTFFFRIHPISFHPSLGVGAVRFAMSGILGKVTQKIVQDYASAWPGVALPFETMIPVRVPSLSSEVVIKIGGKPGDPYVKTQFQFPELNTDLKAVYQGLLVTKQGIHLFANLEKVKGEKDRPLVSSDNWNKMTSTEKIDAIGFGGSDIGTRVSKRVFAFAVARVNDMPLGSKLITLQGKSRFGNLAVGHFGPLYYTIWLEDPSKTKGTMQIQTMSAQVSPVKDEIIKYQATGVVQIEGFAGTKIQLGKPDEKDKDKQYEDKNPIYVKSSPTNARLTGSFVLKKDDPTLPIIAIMMDEQNDIEMTARLKTPTFGHITIHPKFNLPASRMTRIKLPLELKKHGMVKIGLDTVDYFLEMKQIDCQAAESYLTMTAGTDLTVGKKE